MKRFRVLGYSNPINCNSVPVTTIISHKNGVYALFPDLTRNKLNIDSNSVNKLGNFIPEKGTKYISEFEYSYLRNDGSVKSDTPRNLLDIMKQDLKSLHDNEVHQSMLEELIVSETINFQQDKYNLMDLLNISKKFSYIRFFTTTRTKKNHQKAKRIIFQIRKYHGFKTVYKKNLYSNNEFPIKEIKRFENQLVNTIKNLSTHYSNTLRANNILIPIA